jgi:hypothetical protein
MPSVISITTSFNIKIIQPNNGNPIIAERSKRKDTFVQMCSVQRRMMDGMYRSSRHHDTIPPDAKKAVPPCSRCK